MTDARPLIVRACKELERLNAALRRSDMRDGVAALVARGTPAAAKLDELRAMALRLSAAQPGPGAPPYAAELARLLRLLDEAAGLLA